MKQKTQNSSIFTKKMAFTLAEVLITLGIIGIVAEITIPILIANVQKQQYVASYKKAYTILAQALLGIAQDNGCSGNLACTGIFDESSSSTQTASENIVTALSSKLKIPQNCGWNNTATADLCLTPKQYLANISGTTGTTGVHFTTADGIGFSMYDLTGNCSLSSEMLCATVFIDINGTKKPNIQGRDGFLLYIKTTGNIIAHGYNGTWLSDSNTESSNCRTDIRSAGMGCSARIIEEGWQMNY